MTVDFNKLGDISFKQQENFSLCVCVHHILAEKNVSQLQP